MAKKKKSEESVKRAFEILPYLDASYPFLYVRTVEQERAVEDMLMELTEAGDSEKQCYMYKPTVGLYVCGADDPASATVTNAPDFMTALRYTISGNLNEISNRVYFFMNCKPMLQTAGHATAPAAWSIIQQIRDCCVKLRTMQSAIVFVGADVQFHEELMDIITVLDYELPTKEQIRDIFKTQLKENKSVLDRQPTDDEIELAADASVGLTSFKAENAISLSIAKSGGIDIEILQHEKELAVKQLDVMEYVRDLEDMENVGGFAGVKEHVAKRCAYFQQKHKAVEFGCDPPKGIMLVGISGVGKSLIAKAIAHTLGLRLYAFNVGSLFQGVVGASEYKTRHALQMASTLAPAVILFDEFEKLMSGRGSSNYTDGGVTDRVIGTILTWFQDCKDPLYKVATCNTITNLDSALLRRGRWDATFGVDLPNSDERAAIFQIHLKKRGRDIENFDIAKLVAASENCVGAEIESCISDAIYDAFSGGTEVTTELILRSLKKLKPVALSQKEEIQAFRTWLDARAYNASLTGEEEKELHERPARKVNLRLGKKTSTALN